MTNFVFIGEEYDDDTELNRSLRTIRDQVSVSAWDQFWENEAAEQMVPCLRSLQHGVVYATEHLETDFEILMVCVEGLFDQMTKENVPRYWW